MADCSKAFNKTWLQPTTTSNIKAFLLNWQHGAMIKDDEVGSNPLFRAN